MMLTQEEQLAMMVMRAQTMTCVMARVPAMEICSHACCARVATASDAG